MNSKQRKEIHEVFVQAGQLGKKLGVAIEMIEDPTKDVSWEQIAKFDKSLMDGVMWAIRRLNTISEEVINND